MAALLSAAQVAARKGCATSTVHRAIRAGRLPARRVGRAVIITAADAEAWTPQDGPGWPLGRPRKRSPQRVVVGARPRRRR